MSKVLAAIREHFGEYETFSPCDLNRVTKINQKVISMVLKKYHNIEILGYYSSIDRFFLFSEEETKERRQKANDLIDKYDLKQKKYKL